VKGVAEKLMENTKVEKASRKSKGWVEELG